MDKEALHKEIDLIQGCITRMANNSFLLKGWAISIVAVVLALSEDRTNPVFLIIAVLIPLLCFWYLDTFFLHTEKKYRAMYKWVLEQRKQDNEEFQYDLNPHRFDKNQDVGTFCKTFFSITLRIYFGIPVLVCFVVIGCQFLKN